MAAAHAKSLTLFAAYESGFAALEFARRYPDLCDPLHDTTRLPLPGPLVALLRNRRPAQLEERLRAGSMWTGNDLDLVFTTEVGGPMSAGTVSRYFHSLLSAAGLPRQRFHDLRHASASFHAAEGTPIRTAMEALGHSDIATTAEVYQHVLEDSKREATEAVAKLLWR